MPSTLKSALASLAILAPSLCVWAYIIEDGGLPLEYAYLIAYAILLWAVLDFIIIIYIEPYRKSLGALTIPAFIAAVSIVLLYVIAESLNRFIDHLGYGALTPFVAAAVLLTTAAVFREKHTALKAYLSLNSAVLAVLWALGTIDKISLPF